MYYELGVLQKKERAVPLLQNKKSTFFRFCVGHPRRRGVPANPRPLQTPPPLLLLPCPPPPYFEGGEFISEGFSSPFDDVFDIFLFWLKFWPFLAAAGRLLAGEEMVTWQHGGHWYRFFLFSWAPTPSPLFLGWGIHFQSVGLWFDGMIWEFLVFRPDACCGCLEIDTLVWQVGKSGNQGQVRSISGGVGALLLFCVCANVSKNPRISKQVVQKQSWATYLWCSAVSPKPDQIRQKNPPQTAIHNGQFSKRYDSGSPPPL